MPQAELGVEPLRGRTIELLMHDGQVARGILVDAVRDGLQVLCTPGEEPVLARWSRIAKAEFLEPGDLDVTRPDHAATEL